MASVARRGRPAIGTASRSGVSFGNPFPRCPASAEIGLNVEGPRPLQNRGPFDAGRNPYLRCERRLLCRRDLREWRLACLEACLVDFFLVDFFAFFGAAGVAEATGVVTTAG